MTHTHTHGRRAQVVRLIAHWTPALLISAALWALIIWGTRTLLGVLR